MRLLLATSLIGLLGCTPPNSAAPEPNRPLRIVDRAPRGPRLTYFVPSSCVLNQSFSLLVHDDDELDVISSLWFIDQAPNTTPFATTPKAPSNELVREVKAPAAASFTQALDALPLGTHLLTVYVADTAFNEFDGTTVTAGPRQLGTRDGGTTQEPGYVDEFTWVLQVERCP